MNDIARSPGRKPVVETDAFKEAVEAAVQAKLDEAMAKFTDQIQAMVPAAAPVVAAAQNPADVLGQVLSQLSTNIAALNTQGNRKMLTPTEIVEREVAEKKLSELIMASRALPHDERPTYKLIAKTYLNERLIEPYKLIDKRAVHNEIIWTGVPNAAMIPLNDVAKAIYETWNKTTGGLPELVPSADRRPLYATAAGLTVRGDPPKRQFVAADREFQDDLGFSNSDPNAPEVAVLGTVAQKARTNAVTGVGLGSVVRP